MRTTEADVQPKQNLAKQLAENALDQLADALANGKSETLLNYLAVMARFRRYSWNNLLLIALQRPDASHLAGFHAWRKFNRFVRKGAKGIAIFASMVSKKNVKGEDTEDEQTRLFGFRTAYIFDIADTDGEELAAFATVSGDPQHYTERLKEFIAAQGITLDFDARIAPARGLSKGGAIVLLPDLSPAETTSTLAHELAHEMLHKDARRTQTTTTIRETEAEAVAFVVCHAIGLNTGTASADYVQLWQGDKTTLSQSLQFIQSTAIQILTAIGAAEDGLR